MTPPPDAPLTVVGIGADGWAGLAEPSRRAVLAADVVIGAPRQLGLVPPEARAERVAWPSPLRPAVPGLLAAHAGRAVCVLASGDPFHYGIGRALAEILGPERLRVLPHPSSLSYACGRLGWPQEDVEVVTVVGRPLDRVSAALHDGRRLLVLSADAATPAAVAGLLRERGYGPSELHVLERLGDATHERHVRGAADTWDEPPGDPLNVVAVACRRAPGAPRIGAVPGLPDAAYEHDGQLTKRHVRAATLAALAPAPGELLWDVGGGSGSIGIEWMRTHPACRAVTVERDPVRAGRIVRNARTLGVPGLAVATGAAPEALAALPGPPDAIFIGGGLTAPGVLEACWEALPEGGRLVANTVTLESEALLAQWYGRHGGELVRLAVASAVPVGGFTGWRQAMPVTQWSVTKTDRGPDARTDAGADTGPDAGPDAGTGTDPAPGTSTGTDPDAHPGAENTKHTQDAKHTTHTKRAGDTA